MVRIARIRKGRDLAIRELCSRECKPRVFKNSGPSVCGYSLGLQQPLRPIEQHSSTNDARLSVLVAFGQMVREFRKAQGFSQESFAYYCSLDRSYMGGVERGERNITLANMEIIIIALQLKPSEFFAALDGYFANQEAHGQVIQFKHFADRAQVHIRQRNQSN